MSTTDQTKDTGLSRKVKLVLIFAATAAVAIPTALAATTINKAKLSLGDGKVSTEAKRGYLWSCRANNFVSADQAGAQVKGPWFNGDGTWDKTKKISILGSVSWPTANVSFKVSGDSRVISGNGLPTTHKTGTYPVASSDPAYAYDRNPSKIAANTISLTLPANPKVNAAAQCAGGEVGVALSGVMINDSLDAGGRDAVANEVQDSCDGHPQNAGVYHYHSASRCAKTTEQFGWALDGFPIMGSTDPKDGHEITNAELDDCHGRTAEITVGGKKVTMYHYVGNDEYPYTVGCFRGTPIRVAKTGTGGQATGQAAATGQGQKQATQANQGGQGDQTNQSTQSGQSGQTPQAGSPQGQPIQPAPGAGNPPPPRQGGRPPQDPAPRGPAPKR
jgi:hypothetical protein